MEIQLYNSLCKEIRLALAALTPREWDVLTRLAEGKKALQISEELYVTVKSVHNNKNRIGNKLNLKGYLVLDRFAQEQRNVLLYWFGILADKSPKDRLSSVVSALDESEDQSAV